MTHENVIKIATDTYSKCLDLLKTKGHDYASDDDALKNFKESSNIAGIKPINGNLFMIGVKISRLRELILSDKTPKNESVIDTLDDLINYVLLLKCTYIENSPCIRMDSEGNVVITGTITAKSLLKD